MLSLLTQISLILVTMNCPMPEMDNKTMVPYTARDYTLLRDNLKSCTRWYDKSYCMVRFTKIGLDNYYIKCKKRGMFDVQK